MDGWSPSVDLKDDLRETLRYFRSAQETWHLMSLRQHSRPILLALLAILLVGLQLRLTAVLGTEIEAPLRADAGQYFAYAYNLVNHMVYSADLKGIGSTTAPTPDNFRNPGYSLLILPFAKTQPSDASLLNITLLQALLSGTVIALIFFAARTIMPPVASLGVALLTALSPHLINTNVYILSESAAAFTTVLFLAAFIHAGIKGDNSGWPYWLPCGVLLAVATLVRPTMQWFFFPALALILMLPNTTGNKRGRLGWFTLGFLAAMAPWWIRNLLQFGDLSDPALMIATLHHGMYPNFMYAGQPETFGFPYRFDPRSPEIVQNLGSVLAEILRRFTDQTAEHLRWYFIGKPLMFWNWENNAQGAGDVFIYPAIKTPFATNLPLFLSHEAMRRLHWPLVALGMLGCLLCWLQPSALKLTSASAWAWRVSGALLAYFIILHIVGAPFPRYSIPVLPILYLQAVGTVVVALRLVSPNRS